MKKCKKCSCLKPINDFHKGSSKDGYRNDCKICVSEYQKKHSLTINRKEKQRLAGKIRAERYKSELLMFIRRMYSLMQSRVRGQVIIHRKAGRYIGLPICTRKDFYVFALKDWNLKYLFCDWIKYGRTMKRIPTVDRIDNDEGYLLDNIRFITFSENSKKRWESGLLRTKNNIPAIL
jgi:hypothetical protein